MGSDFPDSSKSFEMLDLRVRKWIWEKNWTELHDIQERSIPVILDGQRDVIIGAATGRGKTEAAFLPICSKAVSGDQKGVCALYVSPLKALINDQFERLDSLCERIEIPVHRWHGDVGGGKKKAFLGNPSGILLITPESLEAFFVVRGPRVPLIFQNLQYIVVDELHSFIGSERGAQLRSLLNRVELAIRRRIPRIGLSATLGDMALAADFLRPNGGGSVEIIESKSSGQEVQIQLRGYQSRKPTKENGEEGVIPSDLKISEHLFGALRGQNNLVFANSRQSVEGFADSLRLMAESNYLPQEFWPHHGNLSKSVREDVEKMLKDGGRPTTAVCTSTLELGIDIGAVKSVAQINAPPSVASLRQRLGRSGRRGEPAVLRTYVSEVELGTGNISPQDAIRARLFTCMAMINLLIKGWCEPPERGAFHLSTLVQQVLSAIAQHGGVRASEIWKAFCGEGAFPNVDTDTFGDLLKSIGSHDLIVQADDGTLLLGEVGERIVNHYSFYTAFQTEEEYQVIAGPKVLGTLPLNFGVGPGSLIIFAGRRWRIIGVDDDAKVIQVEAAPGGVPPQFDGASLGLTHGRVREEMRRLYKSEEVPLYLDAAGRVLLEEGRASFKAFGLDKSGMFRNGNEVLLFPWASDKAHNALALNLRGIGMEATFGGLTVSVEKETEEAIGLALRDIAGRENGDPLGLAMMVENLQFEKYDSFLNDNLLRLEFAFRRLDDDGAQNCAKELLAKQE